MKILHLMELLAFFVIVQPSNAQSIEIALFHIGNAANAPDPLTRLGVVSYEFDIGKFNITEAQYTAFLNAVASNDRHRLYSRYMARNEDKK